MADLEQSTSSFPSLEEIDAALPRGCTPYLQLALSLGKISDLTGRNTLGTIESSLKSISKADTDGLLEPPLTTELSNLLQRTANHPLIVHRDATLEDPLWHVDGHQRVLVEDNARPA